jgi:hypothetical protein
MTHISVVQVWRHVVARVIVLRSALSLSVSLQVQVVAVCVPVAQPAGHLREVRAQVPWVGGWVRI